MLIASVDRGLRACEEFPQYLRLQAACRGELGKSIGRTMRNPNDRRQTAAAMTAVAVLVLTSACARQDTLWQRGESCSITVCLNGAGGDRHPGNQVIAELCSGLPGLIEDCSEGPCESTFPSSAGARAGDAIALAFMSAETSTCPISVVGYSLGGVNAVAMAQSLAGRGISIDRMILIDPFSPLGPDPLVIPANVSSTWVYRHSVAPADDCSADRPIIGPYEGFAPACAPESRCQDYDFSADERYRDVDHCTVPSFAYDGGRANVLTGRDYDAASLPIPTTIGAEAE